MNNDYMDVAASITRSLKGYSNRTNVYCFCFLHMVNCMTTSIYVDYLRRVASKSYVKTSALINS